MDQDRFAALFDEHGRAVFNHCLRRTASYETAEDLAAVTFLEAWRKRSDIPPDAVRPWLLGVANNVLRNQARSVRRYRNALCTLPPPQHQQDHGGDVAARLDAERTIAALLPRLNRLSRGEREVIEMCVGSGLTHAEAALALGIPIGTVKSRLSRALAALRAELPGSTAVYKGATS